MNRIPFVMFALCLLAPAASAQPGSATQSEVVVDTIMRPSAAEGMKVLWPYLLVILLIAAAPILVDMLCTYLARTANLFYLMRLAGKDLIDKEELKELLAMLSKAPAGIKGLARTSMAMAVIAVIGLAVFHVLVFYQNPKGEVPAVLTSVLSILGGLVSAVTGFYFGGRAASEGGAQSTPVEPTMAVAVKPQVPTAPQPVSVPPPPAPTQPVPPVGTS